jgi:hypothetical protein
MIWSTDFSKLPKEGRVIVQGKGGSQSVQSVELLQEGVGLRYVAWHPWPEPYAPPKPKQITNWRERVALYDSSVNPYFEDSIKELVDRVEQRTREIVAWEAKHGLEESAPAATPPKPEQFKDWREVELCVFESSSTPAFEDSFQSMIRLVEKRTREIVAWEQKYEVKK